MAFCLISMVSLYILEWKKRHVPILPLDTHERPSLFNISSAKGASLQSVLEIDKLHSTYENIISVQENKKENERLSRNRRLNETLLSTQSGIVSQITLTTTPAPLHRPPSIPILKPRVVGAPTFCRSTNQQHTDCVVYCCSASANQRTLFDGNGDEYVSYLSGGRPQISLHSVESVDSKLNNSESPKENYQPHIEVPMSTLKTDNDLISSSTPFTTVSWPDISPGRPPNIADEHSDHQNQLKPSRDSLQRGKSLNEKNSSEETGGGENEKIIIANQFDQKMKNIYKNDKLPLTGVETEKRVRRGIKFARKDLPKSIESLRLLELNTSVGYEYCNTLQCAQRTGPRFSYLIPISKYMVEEYVTLQFNLAVPLIVDHCQPDIKPLACPVPQNGAGDLPHDYIREQNLTEEVDPNWRLPVGLYLQSTYRFRVQARTVISDTPCSLPATELGHSFIEFILTFQRTCDK